MLIPFISAFIIAGLTPFAYATAWSVPMTLMSRGMALRSAIGSGLFTLFAGLIPLMALPERSAGVVGFVLGAVMMLTSARRLRHTRGTVLLAYRLGDVTTRDVARKALVTRLSTCRKQMKPDAHAALASIAVLPLSAIGAWDEALIILKDVDGAGLEGSNKARHAQAMATCLTERGELESAQDVLRALERPAEDAVERWLVALEALLVAVQGGAERALEMAEEHDDQQDGALSASYAVVRAHAWACNGDEAQARMELERVEAIAGPEGVIRATRPVGPATDLARELLSNTLS